MAVIVIKIVGDPSDAKAALDKVQAELKQTGNEAQVASSKIQGSSAKSQQSLKAMKNSYLAIGAAIAGTAFVFKKIFDAVNRQQAAETQLNQVIKSTGMAAGLTANEIKNMAAELQKVTTFGDEAIIEGQNLLLTFTKIGKDVFPAASEAMLNVSQAMGQSLKSSAVQLGKALNDPIQGIAALQRVGITFSDSQKEMIKTLQDSGDIIGAQKIILKELETQFGGSAKAAAQTFGGQVKQMQNAISDLAETIGKALIPIFTPVVKVITLAASAMAKSEITASALQGSLLGLAGALIAVKFGLLGTATGLKAVLAASGIGLAIAAIATAAILLIKNWDKVKIFFENLWTRIQFGSQKAWSSIKIGFFNAVKFIIKAIDLLLKPWTFFIDKAIEGMNKLTGSNIQTIGNIKNNWLDNIEGMIEAEKDKNKKIVMGTLKTYNQIEKATDELTESMKLKGSAAGSGLGQSLSDNIKKAMEKIGPVFNAAVNAFKDISGRISSIFEGMIETNIKSINKQTEAQKNALNQQFQNRQDAALAELEQNLSRNTMLATNAEDRARAVEDFERQKNATLEKLAKDKAKEEEKLEKKKEREIALAKRKQFNFNKGISIVQAGVDLAGAIMNIWSQWAAIPAVAGALTGVVTALGAAQIGIIAAKQAPAVPALAEGGIIPGSAQGTLIRAGENFAAEAVIPLENENVNTGGGLMINGPVSIKADTPAQMWEQLGDEADRRGVKIPFKR
jgi:hypothetical protein